MPRRGGTADLPLHGGRVPSWLYKRMSRLGVGIVEAIVLEGGRGELLARLSDPFWFQAFGAVLGMDWHSSGITTSVMGALKSGLQGRGHELGIWVCGGRGRQSRQTPDELRRVGERTGLDGEALAQTSRLTAKVDSAAVQDGFEVYLHAFVVTADGDWAVVQQGMNPEAGYARRYHWRSDRVRSFVCEPHSAIVGQPGKPLTNLTDRRADGARDACTELTAAPETVIDLLGRGRDQLLLGSSPRHLSLPAHHEVRATDVDLRRLGAALDVAREAAPEDFTALLRLRGVGRRTLQSLALVAEVIYGAPSRFDDPARFAFAHGGKDGYPHPVPIKVYDQTLAQLRRALHQARLGRRDRLEAFKRLDARTRRIEGQAREARQTGRSLDAIIAEEWRRAPEYGGRTVYGYARPGDRGPPPVAATKKTRQLPLF